MIEVDDKLIEAIRQRLSRYSSYTDFDDAVQEGVIKAWQLIEDGHTDFNKITLKAFDRGRSVLLPSTGAQPVGHIAKTRDGRKTSSGEASREKIAQYRTEFQKLHGRLPTLRQIGTAIGMNPSTVGAHIKALESLPKKSDITTDSGGRAQASIEILSEEFEKEFISFEDRVLDDIVFVQAISKLPDEFQRVLTLRYVYDLTYTEIAMEADLAGNHAVLKILKDAHEQLADKKILV